MFCRYLNGKVTFSTCIAFQQTLYEDNFCKKIKRKKNWEKEIERKSFIDHAEGDI